jgi:aspartate/tyrosine/aromatic aminotransferase
VQINKITAVVCCHIRMLSVLLNLRYQGFATGDCERDARAPRMFLEQGHAIGLSQSFAKVGSAPRNKDTWVRQHHIHSDPMRDKSAW